MWELLAPAGSYESIKAAVNAGADAVYAGGSLFGARAYADNPDEEHLIRGIEYCHLHGCRLYLTVNTLLKEQELEEKLEPFLRPYWQNGVDGLIVQDLGVACLVRERFPGLPLHASTQMTVTGPEGARFLEKMGFTRVVPARELSLAEIRAITAETGLEVETFIHGAMCYCYSGQCLFSSLIGGRSGNRGRCAQPCRLPLRIPDGAGKESGSSCLLSMKDMCTLDLLPDILAAGVVSLKIEGRMKRPEYTAGVVSVYRPGWLPHRRERQDAPAGSLQPRRLFRRLLPDAQRAGHDVHEAAQPYGDTGASHGRRSGFAARRSAARGIQKRKRGISAGDRA